MDGHYRKGEKEGLFSTDLLEQYRQHGKHVHSTSLYLLGKSVLPLFQEKLDCALKPFLPNYEHWHDGGHDYWHIWYLTSMYHDFASCIELGTIHVNDSEGHRSLRFHLGNHNIRYILYGSFPYKLYDIPFRFSPELINNYFYYRACHGMCDHGIIAGYLFFDRFIKNFLGKTGPEPSDKFDENGNMERNVLNWNTDFPMYAAYVADAIICHNVWLGGEAEKATYMQYGLTPLLHTEHHESRLSVEKHPLQFMLCLLDTIEPIKRFAYMLSPREILQRIRLERNENSLSLSWDASIAQQEGFTAWHGSIVGMRDWMCVRVDEEKNGVTIEFQ